MDKLTNVLLVKTNASSTGPPIQSTPSVFQSGAKPHTLAYLGDWLTFNNIPYTIANREGKFCLVVGIADCIISIENYQFTLKTSDSSPIANFELQTLHTYADILEKIQSIVPKENSAAFVRNMFVRLGLTNAQLNGDTISIQPVLNNPDVIIRISNLANSPRWIVHIRGLDREETIHEFTMQQLQVEAFLLILRKCMPMMWIYRILLLSTVIDTPNSVVTIDLTAITFMVNQHIVSIVMLGDDGKQFRINIASGPTHVMHDYTIENGLSAYIFHHCGL